jgi:hypothetical protein
VAAAEADRLEVQQLYQHHQHRHHHLKQTWRGMKEIGMNLIGNRDKHMKLITSLVLLLIASAGMAQGLPNTFTAGTPARAAEVNANFTNLDTRAAANATDIAANAASVTAIDTVVDQLYSSIDFTMVVDETGAAGVNFGSCPSGSIPVSATCGCLGDGVTTNYGYVFACGVVGDGVDDFAVAACFEDWTFDPNLAEPDAFVDVMCVSATQVDGSAATFDSPFIAAQPAVGSSQLKSAPQLKSSTVFEDTELRLRNAISGHRNALLRKQ